MSPRRLALWGHAAGFLPLLYLLVMGLRGRLGYDPGVAIIHALGFAALCFLALTLLLTPLRRHCSGLARLRRPWGLWAFFWALAHVLAYAFLDLGGSLSAVLGELGQRPYLWPGLLAFLILLSLAATSTLWARERMRGAWTRLHRLAYLALPLACGHYWWSLKIKNAQDGLWIAAFLLPLGLWLVRRCRTSLGA